MFLLFFVLFCFLKFYFYGENKDFRFLEVNNEMPHRKKKRHLYNIEILHWTLKVKLSHLHTAAREVFHNLVRLMGLFDLSCLKFCANHFEIY